MAKIFNVGDQFSYNDKYGVFHTCTVISKIITDERDDWGERIVKMTYTYPGKLNEEITVNVQKSEQSDSYGDEYFVSDVTKMKNGFGIANWVFPNRK